MPDGYSPEGSFFGLGRNSGSDDRLMSSKAEQFLLGALLIKAKLIEVLPAGFCAAHFAYPHHAETFTAILAVGSDVESGLLQVSQLLAIDDSERREYLANLVGAAPGFNRLVVQENAAIITDMYRRRQIVALADRARESALGVGGLTADATVALAMSGLEQIAVETPTQRGPVLLVEAVDAAMDAGARFANGERTALSTGFRSLDDTLGGMEPGGLYILAGRPGMGKTALGLQIAVEGARAGAGVSVISLEMQAMQLGRRVLAMESGIAQSVLRTGSWDKRQEDYLFQARQRVASLPLSIEDQGGLNMQMIALRARAAKRRHGLKLLVIDHLHIVGMPAETTRMGATWAVGQISNGLKRLAKELEIPVLALAQLNRSVESRDDKRPNMADLRQSGDIEQDAEAIMLLYRPEYYLGKAPPVQNDRQSAAAYDTALRDWHDAKERLAGKAEVIFEKVRDGSPGTVQMAFDGARTCFREIEV